MSISAPRATRRPARTPLARRVLGPVLALGLAVTSALAAAPSEAKDPVPSRTPATSSSFRVATFNILGASHTTTPRRGFDDYKPRMRRTVNLINAQNFGIVGLQEYQQPQHELFKKLTGDTFGVYPGLEEGKRPVQNSIIWRTSEWTVVEKHLYSIPYFRGTMVPQPYVKLRNREGAEIWVVNTHNPADSKGPAQRYRDRAIAIQADLVNQLKQTGVPVTIVGDFNDRDDAFCDLTAAAPDLKAANGGGWVDGRCAPPRWMRIDWIFLSKAVTVHSYNEITKDKLTGITDHNVIFSDISVPIS